jgi:uncharacterized membrane protein (TIGR02234 family)
MTRLSTGLTSRTGVLGLLAGGGLLAVIASAQPWWRAVGAEPPSTDSVVFSGADATGGLSQALALVVLAGTLLTLVLATRGRRVLAVLLAIAGLGMAVLGAMRLPPSDNAVRTRFRLVSLVEQFLLDATAWPWIYALAGAGVVVGAVLLWLFSPSWPGRRRRFERSSRAHPPSAAAANFDVAADPTADPADTWRALDAGVDPTRITDDPGDDPRDDPSDRRLAENDPGVRIGTTTDTMVTEMASEISAEIAAERSGDGRSDPGRGSASGSTPQIRRRNEDE